MLDFIVSIRGDDGNDWLVHQCAAEEHAAAIGGIRELQSRLPGVNFPEAGSTIRVISGTDLLTSPYEVFASTWSQWPGLELLQSRLSADVIASPGEGLPQELPSRRKTIRTSAATGG